MTQKKYKIVFIGAGSFRFTIPCVLNLLDLAKTYNPVEFWMIDIDIQSLALMTNATKQIVRYHQPKNIKVFPTIDRRKALEGADVVIISISVGIQQAEWFDIHVPLKFGIPQNTGDTIGPGGILRGIRTIQDTVDIVKDIKELCPEADVLNFTNPQGTLTMAAKEVAPKLNYVGTCHELYLGIKRFNKYLKYCGVEGTSNQKVKMLYGGVNHFAWITKLEHNGRDLLPLVREHADYAYQTGKFHRPYNFYLIKKYGYYSYVEDRHVAEFIPKYYNFFNYKDNPFGIKLRDVRNIHKQRSWAYSTIRWGIKRRNHWFLRLVTRPMEGGEKAFLMVKAKLTNQPKHHVCNVRNNGTIPNLPEGCIIEAPCYYKDNKLHTAKVGPLPKPIDEWVRVHAKNQKPVVDAALTGDVDKLLEALLADPMCQFIEDDEKIEYMMKNMLYYQQKWLPNFSESIPTLKELKNLKYSIDWKEISTFESARKEKYKPEQSLKAKAWPQVE